MHLIAIIARARIARDGRRTVFEHRSTEFVRDEDRGGAARERELRGDERLKDVRGLDDSQHGEKLQ